MRQQGREVVELQGKGMLSTMQSEMGTLENGTRVVKHLFYICQTKGNGKFSG